MESFLLKCVWMAGLMRRSAPSKSICFKGDRCVTRVARVMEECPCRQDKKSCILGPFVGKGLMLKIPKLLFQHPFSHRSIRSPASVAAKKWPKCRCASSTAARRALASRSFGPQGWCTTTLEVHPSSFCKRASIARTGRQYGLFGCVE